MGDVNGCCAEIGDTGILGILGISQIDWGGNACYECWKLAPCCGEPDCLNAFWCCFNWIFCFCGATCALYATSLGQKCAIFPHCLCGYYCMPCTHLFTRYNLRRRAGGRGNMIGDWMCLYCCSLCACCQNLRSVPISGWRQFPECNSFEWTVDNVIFIK